MGPTRVRGVGGGLGEGAPFGGLAVARPTPSHALSFSFPLSGSVRRGEGGGVGRGGPLWSPAPLPLLLPYALMPGKFRFFALTLPTRATSTLAAINVRKG